MPDLLTGTAPGTATGYETAPSYSSVSTSTSYDSGPAPPSVYDYPPEQSEYTQYILCGTLLNLILSPMYRQIVLLPHYRAEKKSLYIVW